MKFKFLTPEEEKNLSQTELQDYYIKMRKFYQQQKKNFLINEKVNTIFHNIYGYFSAKIRPYKLEIRGLENIPQDDNVIFACNHSNANDTYTMHETFKKLFHPLAGSDCLNPISYSLIALAGGVFINRDNKESAIKGTNKLIEKILMGTNAVIFPEGTWCLHPAKPVLPFKTGIIKIAAKTNKKIVPVVFCYHEVDAYKKQANQIIDNCIVQIGPPIPVDVADDTLQKLAELRNSMATMLWQLWEENGIYQRDKIDPLLYDNHTNLKMSTPLFKYNPQKEEKYIYHNDDYIYEEFPINRVVINDKKKKRIKK